MNLNCSATILTPNRRLAAHLHKLHQQEQIVLGKKCWETPDILPLTTWIQRLWQQYCQIATTPPALLSPIQEQLLWEKVIRESTKGEHLLRLSETAENVRKAYILLKQWTVDINHSAFEETEDSKALRFWIEKYEFILRNSKFIDQVNLPDVLLSLGHPKEVLILFGFTELAPQIKKLLTIFSKVEHFDLDNPLATQINRISFQHADDELFTLARWAKSIYDKDKAMRVACVLPNLEKIRDRVVQVFSEVFNPELAHSNNLKALPFNISAGKSLSEFPVIQTALQALSLHKGTISRELFCDVITSPFIGEAEQEHLMRYHLDTFYRRNNINVIELKAANLINCPFIEKRFKAFATLIDNIPRTFHDWSIRFNDMLQALGWPGERSLNSEEYQTIDVWMKLLREFATLDYVETPVYFNQAYSTLKKMAISMQFQPESPESNIQILGMLEAASIPFDYIWVAGMDDLSWPVQPSPNPFIPKRLQRELHMPHATAERELAFCSLLTEQFKHSASTVIFSHMTQQDEIRLQISPLLRDLLEIRIEDLTLSHYQSIAECQFESKSIETLVDDMGSPYNLKQQVIGGVDVLHLQALCPFKAFATYRLHARELESPLPGLRAKDRGQVIHKVLELIWAKLNSQDTLLVMPAEDLDVLINQAIDTALIDLAELQKRTQYFTLEKQRLYRLITHWLEHEKLREPFQVLANEQKTQIKLNRLSFSIRIDRVDLLEGQKKLIIDYKTGINDSIYAWFEPRLDAPQLPLYATLDRTETVGISFAHIVTGNVGFKGVSQYDLRIKGIKEFSSISTEVIDWQTQIQSWHSQLIQLSDEFYQGYAKVDPKDSDETCQYCQLKPFCRVYEECHY